MWTGIAASVGEFVFAWIAHDLVLFLGSNHPFALAASNETGESKFVMGLWAGIAIATQHRLDPVIFSFRDHRLVLTLIPLATAGWIFKTTVIERLGESLVDAASGQWLAAHAPG